MVVRSGRYTHRGRLGSPAPSATVKRSISASALTGVAAPMSRTRLIASNAVAATCPRTSPTVNKYRLKKNYVLDTNVLLHDPHAIFRFEDNDVIIPIYVIEEVDQFKREGSERGRNARTIARLLDDLREHGRLALEGRAARVGRHPPRRRPAKRPELAERASTSAAMDHAILQTAFDVRERGRRHARPSSSRWTRTSASAPTRSAWSRETYENQRVEADELDTGVIELEVDRRRDRRVLPGRRTLAAAGARRALLTPNALRAAPRRARTRRTPRSAATTRRSSEIVALRTPREGVIGVRPRNKEQSFALDLLLDENDPPRHARRQGRHRQDAPRARRGPEAHDRGRHVHAHARLASGHAARPRHRLLARATSTRSSTRGCSPSSTTSSSSSRAARGRARAPTPSSSRAGRSRSSRSRTSAAARLPQQYIIVDEAQNLTPHEVKTIITRSRRRHEDRPHRRPGPDRQPVRRQRVERAHGRGRQFRGEKLAAHISLAKGERSELAELAANLL